VPANFDLLAEERIVIMVLLSYLKFDGVWVHEVVSEMTVVMLS
jgi:hypothetical protein